MTCLGGSKKRLGACKKCLAGPLSKKRFGASKERRDASNKRFGSSQKRLGEFMVAARNVMVYRWLATNPNSSRSIETGLAGFPHTAQFFSGKAYVAPNVHPYSDVARPFAHHPLFA